MIEIPFVRVNCPYCGKENKLETHMFPTWWAAACDEEVGGCGKIFVYRVFVEPRAITRKVAGEE